MKLAELLIERSETQKRIAIMANRLNAYATIQEGDEPPIKPDKVLKKLDALHVNLEDIIKKINMANMTTEFEPGLTLADAVTRRDVMKSRRNIYNGLVTASMISDSRYSKKEIKFVTTLDVDNILEVTDDLAKEIRILDSKIQLKNWEVEIP
ncbi:MAG: DIP1984 family protein [Deltaproteobacteria bacterium]|nr:DIP1984 family protein [Deltaproteobacteria bacterium]